MRATRVLLWRGCQAGVWLTHGLDHPDGGLQVLTIHTEFQLGIRAVTTSPLAQRILPISDSLSTFPLPGVCASLKTAMD